MVDDRLKLPVMMYTHLLIPWLSLLSRSLAMDLYPNNPNQPAYRYVSDIVEGLEIYARREADAVLFQDFPDEFFGLFEAHENMMLENIRKAYDLEQSMIVHDNPDAIPLARIIEKGLAMPSGPNAYRFDHEFHNLYVHCEDFLPLEPLLIESRELLERMNRVYTKAQTVFDTVRNVLSEAQESEWPVFDIYISGHMSGTAVAQLVGLSLMCDEELGFAGKGIHVYTIGFGEFRIFSPKMISELKKLGGFNMRNHIVFSSLEHYFSPNIGAVARFGTVLDFDIERVYGDEKRVPDDMRLIRNLEWNDINIGFVKSIISSLIVDGTSPETFIQHAPDAFGNFSSEIWYLSIPRVLGSQEFSLPFVPDRTHRQRVFSACVIQLQNMFKKYYTCLRRPDYYFTISHDKEYESPIEAYESYHDVTASIHNRKLGRRIDFSFRIFPWHRVDDYWTTFGMYKLFRGRASLKFVEPYVKDRNHFFNWVEFFRKQWARISGEGSSMIKRISPFFDESILFNIGIPECYIALSVDHDTLLEIFLNEDIEVKRFVRDVFGPLKSPNYRGFAGGQKLFKSPRADASDSGIHQYLLPQGRLLEVVKKFFDETSFDIQDLVSFAGVKALGSFSIEHMASYRAQNLITRVKSEDVIARLRKEHCLHRCDEAFVGKHAPLLSVETPTNPFWRRIFKLDDIYISFIGASAMSLSMYTATKHDLIMQHVGPAAQERMKYSKTGSYVVLQVFSTSWGFGPCSQQGTFYLLIIQDPQQIE